MKLIKQLRLAPTKNNLLNALIVTTALVGIQTHSQAQTSKFEGTRLYLGNSFLSSNFPISNKGSFSVSNNLHTSSLKSG